MQDCGLDRSFAAELVAVVVQFCPSAFPHREGDCLQCSWAVGQAALRGRRCLWVGTELGCSLLGEILLCTCPGWLLWPWWGVAGWVCLWCPCRYRFFCYRQLFFFTPSLSLPVQKLKTHHCELLVALPGKQRQSWASEPRVLHVGAVLAPSSFPWYRAQFLDWGRKHSS